MSCRHTTDKHGRTPNHSKAKDRQNLPFPKTSKRQPQNHGSHNTRGRCLVHLPLSRVTSHAKHSGSNKKNCQTEQESQDKKTSQTKTPNMWGNENKGKKTNVQQVGAPPNRKQGEQATQPNQGKHQGGMRKGGEARTLYTTWWMMM